MTPDKTPTDSEILDAAEDFRSQYKHGGTTFDDFDALAFGRAVLAVEAEARAQDTALIRQLVEALESVDGAMPFPVARQVLQVARSRLLDSDLSKLTARGAVAWTGIDAQDLRDGGKP